MEFNVGKVGINLGGYGIFLGDKGSLSVYTVQRQWTVLDIICQTEFYMVTRT